MIGTLVGQKWFVEVCDVTRMIQNITERVYPG